MKKNLFKALVFISAVSSPLFQPEAQASPWKSGPQQIDQFRGINSQDINDERKACYELNRILKTTNSCDLGKFASKDLSDFEKALQLGAIYASKFVPALNSDNSANNITNTIFFKWNNIFSHERPG